jgi:hypothetical protein
MRKLHRGRDRRILLACKLHLTHVRARDVRTTDPQPTRKISTRMQVFDLDNTDLLSAVLLVDAMLDRELAKQQV